MKASEGLKNLQFQKDTLYISCSRQLPADASTPELRGWPFHNFMSYLDILNIKTEKALLTHPENQFFYIGLHILLKTYILDSEANLNRLIWL